MLASESLEYSKTATAPAVSSVTIDGLTVPASDYGVTTEDINVTNSATATVSITKDSSNFTGSATATFAITPKPVTLKWSTTTSWVYDGQPHTPTASVKSGDLFTGDECSVTLEDSTGKTNASDSSYTAKATALTNSNYQIAESAVTEETYTITPKSITGVTVDPIADQPYTGSAIEPGLTVKDGQATLAVNTDYTVEYLNNVNVSDNPVIKITGTGNYKDQTVINNAFKITPVTLGITWKFNGSTTLSTVFDGQDHAGEVQAEATGAVGSDTAPELSTAVNPSPMTAKGTYTATASFKDSTVSNYVLPETVTQDYQITGKAIEKGWIDEIDNQVYTGSAIEPVLTITDPDLGELALGTDYTVSYTSNVNVADTPVVTVTGINNYASTATTTFTIEPKAIEATWIAAIDDQTYSGSALEPELTITDPVRGAVLVKGTDYTVTYTANINVADTPVVTVTGINNYKSAPTTTFKIVPKAIEAAWIAAIDDQTYSGSTLEPELTITDPVRGAVLVKGTDYTVTYTANINVADTPVVTVTGINNYKSAPTTTFKIVPKEIKAEWIAEIESQIYTGFAIEPELTVTDPDRSVDLVLNTDYTVTYTANINVADTTVVTVTGINNYKSAPTTTFKILPKAIEDKWLTPIDNQIYTGSAIEPKLTITDPDRKEELIVDKDYTVTYADNINVADKPVVTVTGIGNYEDKFTTTFVIDPKDIGDKSITIDPVADEVYTTKAIEPEPVVTDTDELKAAKLVKGEDYTVTYANNVKVSDTTELGAAQITITGKGNYTGTNGTTFIITRKPVKAITTTVNGPTEDTKRLGGPDSSRYHTITIDAQANEKMTVTIFRDGAVVTALKDFTAGDITIEKDAINGATLDGSGDVTYTVYAEYDDKDNLTTDAKSSRDSKPAPGVEDKFNYDTVAKAITVHPLYNRAAKGVGVTLPEGYRLVKFTSSGAGTEFVATNAASLAAGDHVIPFDVGENPKLNSTAKGGTFTGLYEDYVGNPGKVDKQDILKAKGTIEIISVEPPINDSGRIGNTPNLIFTVKMGADGGYSELANGGVFGTRTLSQGEQQITVAASSLVADGTNTPSLSFDDLEGSATFRSFIFDPVCDEPVLTFEPYAGCYYLMGLAEPYSQIVIEVNGEKVTGSADAFGVFALKMPLTEEGDIISIRVTDLAGNVTTTSYRVGPEIEDATMTAFMAGRVYTNSHGMKGGRPDWTMILTASVDDLKAGNVNVPIIAGNMVSIGTMSVKMDGNNNLSYSYTLEDGVQVLNEKFIANTKLEKDAFIAGLGIEVSPNGTLISDIQKGKVYLSCKMNVKVPAEMLKTTFQTEKIKDSDLKKRYRDIQNGKLN